MIYIINRGGLMNEKKLSGTSPEGKFEKISAFEPATLVLGIVLAVLSAIICMQIIGKVGVTPNTSLIGAIIAMVIARIPLSGFKKFKSLERQNMVQTIVSGAGFSAANCGLLAIGIFIVLGKNEFVLPMAVGSIIGVTISIFVVGKIFDSEIFPADEAWPPGVATAQALEAGDEGGTKGIKLLIGIVIGAICGLFKVPLGKVPFNIPAAGIGIVFIANIFSMIGLGLGLLIRGYSPVLFNGLELGKTSIPSGIMIGAGLMALIQSLIIILKDTKHKQKDTAVHTKTTVTKTEAKRTIVVGFLLYLAGAVVIALISGIVTQMSTSTLILWVLWAAVSCTVAILIVGMAAMHSGWFPAFAITTIFMTIGIFLKFPLISLALLTGYISSTGPCFADMGYDLKTGWIIRGRGVNVEHEKYGRKQQVIIEMIGGIIGIIVVLATLKMFVFGHETPLLAPVSKTFAEAISKASDPQVLKSLLLWAVPGAALQLLGGPKRMVGVLFATGLLINNPIYGIGVIAAVIIRLIFGNKVIEFIDAGLIAGDGLGGFVYALLVAIGIMSK